MPMISGCKAISRFHPRGVPIEGRSVPLRPPMLRFLKPLLILLLQPVWMEMACGQGGSVSGVVPLPKRPAGRIAVEKYTGNISGKVAPPPPLKAGVWLEGPGAGSVGDAAKVVLAQQGYQFTQSLIIVAVGTRVEFPNLDADYHNIRSFSRAKRFELHRYKKDESPQPSEVFDKPGFVRLGCEIHDHMSGGILVVDSRWRTLTDAEGRFTLLDVAPGTYTLHAQLDEKTRWSAPVVVRAGNPTIAPLQAVGALP